MKTKASKPGGPRLRVIRGKRAKLERELLKAALQLEPTGANRYLELMRQLTPAANTGLRVVSE